VSLPDLTLEQWSYIATIGGWIVSAGSLFYATRSMSASARAHDLDWLYRYQREVRELEDAITKAANDVDRQLQLTNILNFLEISAQGLKSGLFPRNSSAVIKDHLISSLATINAHANNVTDVIDSPEALSNLLKFIQDNRAEIERLAKAREDRNS